LSDAAAAELGARTPLNAILILGARTASRAIALVMVLVQANHLGPRGYGAFGTVVAYSALVGVFADLGLSTLYTREAARRREDAATYLSTLLLGKLPLVGIAIGLLALSLWSGHLLELLLPGACLLALSGYSGLLRNTFYATGRLGYEVVAILGEIVIQGGLIFYGAHSGAGVPYFLWAYAASYAVGIAYCLAVIPRLGIGPVKLRFDRGLYVRWLRMAAPLAAGFLLTNLYFRADIPILQHFRPLAEVGWYQLAYKPFEATQFIPLAVQAVVYPLLSAYFALAPDRLDRAYQGFFKVLLMLGWPLTVAVLVLAHPIGRILHLFAESEPALRILSLAIVFLFCNSAFTAMLYSIDRQDRYALATGIAAAVNIGLNLALIPTFGYLAASGTTVVTEATLSIAGFLLVGRSRLPWVRIAWRPLLAGLVLGTALLPMAGRSPYLGLALAVPIYLLALWLTGSIDADARALIGLGIRRLRRRGAPVRA